MTTKTKKFTVRADKTDDGMAFRAFRGDLPVGVVYVRITRTGYGYLSGMYVRSDQRRKGAASALMDAVLEQYGSTCRIELICKAEGPVSDADLGSFYERYGFAYGPSAWTTRDPRDSDSRRMFRDAR